jgi:multisubunit Na+/H+ antiporter MnhB subunit
MRKGFWVLILILLFAASIYLYKLNMDKENAIANGDNETNPLENLDRLENIYFWILGAIGVIVVMFVISFLLRKKTF